MSDDEVEDLEAFSQYIARLASYKEPVDPDVLDRIFRRTIAATRVAGRSPSVREVIVVFGACWAAVLLVTSGMGSTQLLISQTLGAMLVTAVVFMTASFAAGPHPRRGSRPPILRPPSMGEASG